MTEPVTIIIPAFSKSIVLAEPGPRIMLVQLVYGLLSRTAITSLKGAYGSLAQAIHLNKLNVAVFVSPVEDLPAKFIPLILGYIFIHIHGILLLIHLAESNPGFVFW